MTEVLVCVGNYDRHNSPHAAPDAAHHHDDIDRYTWMEREYRREVGNRKWHKHCAVVIKLGAIAFDIPVDDILARDNNREKTDKRHKIMAFARVATGATFHQLADAFNRKHSAVAVGVERFEAIVRRVIDR
ncbi:hypothetical protein [Bradyrhizobium valentinum]|uniref:Chromosomal replication initiator DnaA C-terminal domain-containing protein n=1 Tax=Bradyrhizobium valentinum TaxID=1518501 RepID=A0A0R3L0C0_9BRAD|nr:hypothetical protein [Bradyrhizobium valentinum]KRQ99246.1 hypothetical protein CP49_11655 [Bradyrhizobium valentinum]